MAKKDKVLVAFLVSMGMFSSAQAAQYVNNLSAKDKSVLLCAEKDGGTSTDTTPPNRIFTEN